MNNEKVIEEIRKPLSDQKVFIVWHERGGYIQVFAKDKEDAAEQYYHSIENVIGHHLGICRCFGEKKSIDRNLVLKITKIDGPFESMEFQKEKDS